MIKERDEYLAKMQREGEEILQRPVFRPSAWCSARKSSARPRPRPVAASRRAATRPAACGWKRRTYCDQKLAAFEVVLDRTIKTVAAGRVRLCASPVPVMDGRGGPGIAGADVDDTLGGEDAFFDQDRP